jgi:hypothetical protein
MNKSSADIIHSGREIGADVRHPLQMQDLLGKIAFHLEWEDYAKFRGMNKLSSNIEILHPVRLLSLKKDVIRWKISKAIGLVLDIETMYRGRIN